MTEEQRAGNEPTENELASPELKHPDEAIKDLEPEEQVAEDITGGSHSFLKLGGIGGE